MPPARKVNGAACVMFDLSSGGARTCIIRLARQEPRAAKLNASSKAPTTRLSHAPVQPQQRIRHGHAVVAEVRTTRSDSTGGIFGLLVAVALLKD